MASDTAARLSEIFKSHQPLTLPDRLRLVMTLSWPAIMAQLSSILMEYIDATMVGSLGASASASIGLVSTSTWLFWGIGGALSTGFSVQVAHFIGAGRDDSARRVFQQALIWVLALGVLLCAIGVSISHSLPCWLGGNAQINRNAGLYFMIIALSLPFSYLTFMSSSVLRCSGNMFVPGLMNVVMCVLDVVFNFFLIFGDREIWGIHLPGAGLGVAGAATGTALAEVVTGFILLYFIVRKSRQLNFRGRKLRFEVDMKILHKAVTIGLPIAAERVLMNGAQILLTVIVAPLGTVAIAANAFGITAESLCYMPGYGVGDAATTLVGQSIGAKRHDMAVGFGKTTIIIGMMVMSVMGLVMWLCAPALMSMFTPDAAVRALGAEVLRIEAWAEPMFAAAIVTYGVMVGAGYTLVPTCINLASMWVVRLTLAALLAPVMGLKGVWLAMCIELCVRGASFLVTFAKADWMKLNTKAKQHDQQTIEELNEQLNEQQPPYGL